MFGFDFRQIYHLLLSRKGFKILRLFFQVIILFYMKIISCVNKNIPDVTFLWFEIFTYKSPVWLLDLILCDR